MMSIDNPSIAYSTYKLKSSGQKFINGVSSKYDCEYSPMLENVVSDRELHRIIDELNDTLLLNWPCNICYISGYACAPCTLGLSLLIPGQCASIAEREGQKFLKNVSLTARFYDKHIVFSIVKTLCDSYVEIRFPSTLIPRSHFLSSVDLESGLGNASVNVGGMSNTESKGYHNSSELSPLLNSISGGRRIKDN